MIGLMDCNNFFVSCERLFRPDLLKKPVAVLSSNDGCIVSRSQEVKDLGIPMGAPLFQVKDICVKNKITLFSSNFTLYRDISARVMTVLKEEFETCEVYSVDEAFFTVPDSVSEAELHAIRARIIQKTGIPVSFGIGSTKTIAKIASKYAKQGTGVCIFDAEKWQSCHQEVKCGAIWGIGRQLTCHLSSVGIQTVADLLARDRSFYRNKFGVVGERLYWELSGTSMYAVGNETHDIPQSMMSTRSFPTAISDQPTLESALSYHIMQLGEKLRAQGLVAHSLTVIVAPGRFGDYALRQGSQSIVLPEPTASTTTLIKHGLAAFHSFFDVEVPYKRAGAIVHGLVPRSSVQDSLFTQGAHSLSDKLMAAIDGINGQFGQGTIGPAVALKTTNWRELKQLKSPEYSTNWTQIASAKAR